MRIALVAVLLLELLSWRGQVAAQARAVRDQYVLGGVSGPSLVAFGRDGVARSVVEQGYEEGDVVETEPAQVGVACQSILALTPTATSCSPNYIYRTELAPNDIYYSTYQYALPKIGAPQFWDEQVAADNVVVAIVDTGIDYNHSDLATNIWINEGEIPNNQIDDDNNGVVDDVYGMNTLRHNGDVVDDNGHGTLVSGVIGATGNNELGISGVAWRVKLMAVKVLDASGAGTTMNAAEGIMYATRMGAKVINASWGAANADSAVLKGAIQYAAEHGVMFVAAAGNTAQNNDHTPHFPSNYQLGNMLAVAASGTTDGLAPFSNFGATMVHLAAPGENIISTYPGENYATASGTSLAAPFVTAAVALIRSRFPLEDLTQLRTRILSNVDPFTSFTGKLQSGGRLNLDNAGKNCSARQGGCPPPDSNDNKANKTTPTYSIRIAKASVTQQLSSASMSGYFSINVDSLAADNSTPLTLQLSLANATCTVNTFKMQKAHAHFRAQALSRYSGSVSFRLMRSKSVLARASTAFAPRICGGARGSALCISEQKLRRRSGGSSAQALCQALTRRISRTQ